MTLAFLHWLLQHLFVKGCLQALMRRHYVDCLEQPAIKPFPGHQRLLPQNEKMVVYKVKVFYSCRMPDDGKKYIECSRCQEWYHPGCENIPSPAMKKKTNIMMRRWNHNVILFRGISRFLSEECRRWFPGQSGDRTCLVLYKRLVICFSRPFQLLPSACTSDIPLTLSWKFSGKFLFNFNPSFSRALWLHTRLPQHLVF